MKKYLLCVLLAFAVAGCTWEEAEQNAEKIQGGAQKVEIVGRAFEIRLHVLRPTCLFPYRILGHLDIVIPYRTQMHFLKCVQFFIRTGKASCTGEIRDDLQPCAIFEPGRVVQPSHIDELMTVVGEALFKIFVPATLADIFASLIATQCV